MLVENKIIFTGPVGVGKTTAIAALSDEPPIQTDASASDMTAVRKGYTTVAMDYGLIQLDENTKVHLYGTARISILVTPMTTGAVFNKSANESKKNFKSFKGLTRVLSSSSTRPILP